MTPGPAHLTTAGRASAGSTEPRGGQGRAVLIIDDEATLASNLAVYLQRQGWETQVAGSAEEGLTAMTGFRPDIVLLDHNLPGANGIDTLARIRVLDPQARVVIMTGYGSVDLAVSAMRQGAADFLAKPVGLGELKLALERLMDERRLQTAVDYYRHRDAGSSGLDKIVGASPGMRALRERVAMLLQSERALTDGDIPAILIRGETGCGKELVARALHYDGARAARPFVELNCGALPQQLVEAELFGYERGAFTDARQRKPGLVETAEGGTLFLDEIAEADLGTQVKLLKLLEDRRFRRLGGVRDQHVNLRIISATHQPLEQLVRDGRFRADLYCRLRIVELVVPPLRERGDDILELARHFLAHHAARYRRPDARLDDGAASLLLSHPWPGNVRELRNAIEQALLLAQDGRIGRRELGFLAPGHQALDRSNPELRELPADASLNLEQHERRLIQIAMARSGNNVTQAARLLGITRDTLRYRLERLQLA